MHLATYINKYNIIFYPKCTKKCVHLLRSKCKMCSSMQSVHSGSSFCKKSLCCFSWPRWKKNGKQTSLSPSVHPLSLDMGSRPTLNYHSQSVMRLSGCSSPIIAQRIQPTVKAEHCGVCSSLAVNKISFLFHFVHSPGLICLRSWG